MNLFGKFIGISKCQLNYLTHRTFTLPFLVLNITTNCNSRCQMCDFWKNPKPQELSLPEIKEIAGLTEKLNIKKFIVSGGEPLLHSDFSGVMEVLGKSKAKIGLATNGILLAEYASLVAKYCSTVFVSLDGSSSQVYRNVRGVDALASVMAGVKKLKTLNPLLLVIGRNIIQKSNYLDLVAIIKTAREWGMDHISFSAADVKNAGFGRSGKVDSTTAQGILLDEKDLIQFKQVITSFTKTYPKLFSTKFIIEGYKNLINIHNYYSAMLGRSKFPPVYCNLPWLYAAVDADGKVRPCCLRQEIGNIRERSLGEIVTSAEMIEFRKQLKKQKDSKCSHCAYSSAKVHLKMLCEMF